MERTVRRKARWTILGVAIMLGVGTIWSAWPRKRSLLENTVKVAMMEGGNGGNRDYVWASDHEVMLYSETVLEDQILNRMLLYDTNSGIDQPLRGLSERLKAWLSDSHLLVQTSDLVPGGDSTAHSVNFYEVNLASEAAPRTWTVSLPQEWIIKQVVFSPHADHVAWVFHQQYLSPLLIQLKRLGLPVKTKPIEETMVYVSRNDGTEMRQIGIAPSQEHASDVEIKWLPGGKRLSFVYNDALYTIPTF